MRNRDTLPADRYEDMFIRQVIKAGKYKWEVWKGHPDTGGQFIGETTRQIEAETLWLNWRYDGKPGSTRAGSTYRDR